MSNVQRRLELAFDFFQTALKNPEFLESIPDRAVITFGDEDDPDLTAESRRLLAQADVPPGFDRGLIERNAAEEPANSKLEYQSIEAP